MKSIVVLRKSLRSFWSFLFTGWRFRQDISALCDAYEELESTRLALRNAHARNMEISLKLRQKELECDKSQGHVRKLCDFVAIRSGIDVSSVEDKMNRLLRNSE